MKRWILAAPVILFLGTAALAQDALVGSYKGSFQIQTNRGNTDIGVTLVIAAVDDGKLRGTGTLHRGPCSGDYPLEGYVKGNAVGVRSTAKGGAAGDCTFFFKGIAEGNRLVGNMGKYEVELRK